MPDMMKAPTKHEQWLGSLPVEDREVLSRGQSIAERMVANIKDAGRFIALREGLRDRLREGSPFANALAWHTPYGIDEVMRSLVSSVTLSILRVSENPSNEASLSACSLAGILCNERITAILTSDHWVGKQETVLSFVPEYERQQQPKRIAKFKSLVPCGWSRGDMPPDDNRLAKARDTLRSMRDRAIAHSDSRQFVVPSLPQVQEAFEISREIVELGSLIFLGTTSGLDSDAINKRMREHSIWNYFEDGLVSAHRQWSNEASSIGDTTK